MNLSRKISFLVKKNKKNEINTKGENKGNPYGKALPIKSSVDTIETIITK